jgi:hypothetical protein
MGWQCLGNPILLFWLVFVLATYLMCSSSDINTNGQAVCGVAASCGVACFLNAGKKDNLVINRCII